MFERQNNNQLNNSLISDDNIPNLEQEMDAPTLNNNSIKGEIYTMPDKFTKPQKSSMNKNKLILVGLGAVIVLGLLIAAAVYLFTDNINDQQNNLLNTPIQNQPIVNEPIINNQPVIDEPVEEPDVLATPEARDEQRLKDIVTLRSALALYYLDFNAYPDIMEDLQPVYIEQVPTNPNPGGSLYTYLPKDNNQSYKLTFGIEVGGKLGTLNLKSGEYQATPDLVGPLVPFDDTPVEEEPIDEEPNYIMGLDSDNDGLTDIEENIYKSDSTLVDSDGDGYSDATEVVNTYSTLSGPGDYILDSEVVTEYYNSAFNYKVYYPSIWTLRELTSDKKEILFNSATTEYIQVLVQDNPLGLSAKDWYLRLNPQSVKDDLTDINMKNFSGVQSKDGLHTYISRGSYIFAIIYNLGTSNQLNYLATYRMVLRSFAFVDLSEIDSAGMRDEQRTKDINNIRNSLLAYKVTNLALPEVIDNDVDSNQIIGVAGQGCDISCGNRATAATCLNLTPLLVPDYLEAIPNDPLTGTDEISGYYLNLLTDGTLVLGSCQAEVANKIIAY